TARMLQIVDEVTRDRTRTAVHRFLAKWDARAGHYGSVRFGSAIARDNRGLWGNLVTYLLPLHKTHVGEHDGFAEYGDVKIATGIISLENARTIVENVLEKSVLQLERLMSVPLEARSATEYWFQSSDRRLPVMFSFDELKLYSGET